MAELSYDEKVKRYVVTFACDDFSKSYLGRFFNVSPRTIGRWLDVDLENEFYDQIEVVDAIGKNIVYVYDTKGRYVIDFDKKTLDYESTKEEEKVEEFKRVKFEGIVLPTTIAVLKDGIPTQIHKEHQFFNKIKELIENNVTIENGVPYIDETVMKQIVCLVDTKHGLEEYSNGAVKVTPSGVTFNGELVNNVGLSKRILQALVKDGDEDTLEALTNFLIKLKQNPAFTVVDRLYDFIGSRDIRVTKEGNLICFKVVRSTYMDKHSNTFDNSPGQTPKMERCDVDDNHNAECSKGLHVCNKNYISHFYSPGDRIVEVEVNPKDWVTVCPDYSFSKSRVCEYKVLRDVTTDIALELGLN